MKYLNELIINLSQFINPDFFTKDLSVDEFFISDFSLTNYDLNDFTYYVRSGNFKTNKESIEKNLESIKRFIKNDNNFSKINKYDLYRDEIITFYLDIISNQNELSDSQFKAFIEDPNNLDLILKSSKYCYLFLENKKLLDEKYFNKHKEQAEIGLLSGNLFWAYKYAYFILDGPFDKLEKDHKFINDNKIINKYFLKIVFRRGFFDPQKDPKKIFYKYWNNPILSQKFKEYFSTWDLIDMSYYLRDVYFPELDEYLIEKHLDDYVQYFINITFLNLEMGLEPNYITKDTEKIGDRIKRMSIRIKNDPKLMLSFLFRMRGYEGVFKKKMGIEFDEYIKENIEGMKKVFLKDHESLLRFISSFYLRRHSLVKKEYPEAIKVILDSKDPDTCIYYVKDLILEGDRGNIDPKELQPFLDIISTSAERSVFYSMLTNAPFPQGEEVIFKNPESKKEYLNFMKELKEKKKITKEVYKHYSKK